MIMVSRMKINFLCSKLGFIHQKFNHKVSLICDDSRKCIPDSIFFAIRGDNVDGSKKIDEAILLGARTIFTEDAQKEIEGINIIQCDNVKKVLALALSFYYSKVVKRLKFIGVIGTNGKTTTSTLIHKYLEYCNHPSMLIGSNGCMYKTNHIKHNNTTPNATVLYEYFLLAQRNKINSIVMEVSSISVEELRVLGIPFYCLVYTNFSEDHLDYHENMDRYLFAKTIPFYQLNKNSYAIINIDDEASKFVRKHTLATVITYGRGEECQIQMKNLKSDLFKIQFVVDNRVFESNLVGEFNAYNILPLFAIAKIFNLSKDKIKGFLKAFRYVDGRMNYISLLGHHVIIDYAHTEEAVRNVLATTQRMAKGMIYVVVGCGGNRQKEKREKIGKLLSDANCEIILTNDNPRFEKPSDIILDILKGISRDVVVIEDRKTAIFYGLKSLKENDVLLILGKGCEDYMDILGKKKRYSDFEVLEEWKVLNHNNTA